jgi:hypothetical protein
MQNLYYVAINNQTLNNARCLKKKDAKETAKMLKQFHPNEPVTVHSFDGRIKFTA